MSDSQNSVLSGLAALRADCVARLEQNEDYRALGALDRAIADIKGEISPIGCLVTTNQSRPTRIKLHFPLKDSKSPSQADAAAVVLFEADRPMTIAALVPLVRARGAQVAGNDPQTNLSSSLSRDGRFQSLRIEGVAHWALKSDLVANGGSEGGETPSAVDEDEV